MKRYICDRCKRNYKTEESVEAPVFTVVGGLAGTVAGLFTGVILLVPISLFAGLAADTARCDECGSDKDLYKVMVEKENKWGEKIYQPIPRTLYDPAKSYRFDELGRFQVVEDVDDSMDAFEMEIDVPESIDYDCSFDVDDASLDVGFDLDVGEFGSDAGFDGDLGTGDSGGDFGGEGGTGK